jgi:hypothetical protein
VKEQHLADGSVHRSPVDVIYYSLGNAPNNSQADLFLLQSRVPL